MSDRLSGRGEQGGGSDGPRAFVDLHCHSSASFDSLSSPADLVRVASERGLTHLAITDHERIDGALEARERAPDGLTVIVGEEIRSTECDIIGLFLERAVPPGLSPLETIAAIHEQGGVAGLPHPFDRFRLSGLRDGLATLPDQLAAQLDFVEAYNARTPFAGANRRAAEYAHAHGLPGVASSDAHTLLEVGVAYTVLRGPIRDAEQLRRSLRVGCELVPGRASLVVRGMAPAAKLVQRIRGNRRVGPASAPPGASR
ncbi:CehA/McbA family metallohydrolase [soil metagenome]